ncbi:hypothetical protein [Antribacter gilvus]|uniref:hypothetical protein n=1 Tax=Antribacter gilvus TaxID=2304675 RepID=UPI000F7B03C0|nr:hypothetical protein [Antribacter gilvus]
MTSTSYHARTTRTLTVEAEDGFPDLYTTHLRDAVREADAAGVPDHASVRLDVAHEFTQVVTFTWTDEVAHQDQDASAVRDDGARLAGDLLEVWPTGPDGPAEKVWADDLAACLNRHARGAYAWWDGRELLAAARRYGLPAVQVKRNGTNKRGLTHADIATAAGQEG